MGLAPSTVHGILVRCRISRLAHLDRATGHPVRRYEHPSPGALVHIDIKKLGTSLLVAVTGSWAELLVVVTARRIGQAARPAAIATR